MNNTKKALAFTTYAIVAKTNFLFEEWSESYIQYDEVNTTEEKLVLDQEQLWTSGLSSLAERCGA